MQNLKRALSLILVIAMVASFMVCASAETAEQLTDLSESKYQPEVRVLNALDIVEGYEDGTYKPAKAVSRAELALILARVRVGGDKEMIRTYNYGHMTYTDILANGYEWAASGIQYCTDNGMVVGNGNGQFRPGDTVTIVEALKMLLTALGYDAEKEGLQNVGAAWKANTLSLAKEVGLMNRVYGDTNKACTRDDIALLIYNFLMSKVVKGYYESNVPNVDTTLYDGGTSLEVYFGKQVVYGAIVANEAADLDVYTIASTKSPDFKAISDDNETMPAGQTQLFLYDNDEGVTLADLCNGKQLKKGKVVDDYFLTVKGLSTGLEDIGESVFVITDLEPTKGTYYAAGGVCFVTGNNEVGVDVWQSPNLRGLTGNETLYFEDYDYSVDKDDANAMPAGVGNGDHVKTVDFDGDGTLDVVLVEQWGMTKLNGVRKNGYVESLLGISLSTLSNAVIEEGAEMSVANWHEADGTYYFVAADVVADTKLADDRGAINYRNVTVTLADGETYGQSDITVNVAFTNKYYTDLMDCTEIPKTSAYNWYLDCGGYIRAYGDSVSANNNPVYLLTDASNEYVGRKGYAQTVDAAYQSTEVNTYDVTNAGILNSLVNRDGEAKYGKLNPALGDNVTNLAKTGVSEDGTSANLAAAGTIAELNMKYKDYNYGTTDAMGRLGDYNKDHGIGDDRVLTTTDTDYYYVTLDKDRQGKVFVAGVEYYAGYLEMPAYNFNAAENVYALVNDSWADKGDHYYTASVVVIETFDLKTTTSAPYFAYYHVSSNQDGTAGQYDVVNPSGELETVWIADQGAHVPGFYARNNTTETATRITENWVNYGLKAGTVYVNKASNDYYLINSFDDVQIKITTEVPVYEVTKAGAHGTEQQWEQWDVTACEHGLQQGDSIIYGWNGRNATYVLVVNSERENWTGNPEGDNAFTGHDLQAKNWAAYKTSTMKDDPEAHKLYKAIANSTALDGTTVSVYKVFADAVAAYALDSTDANYVAALAAFVDAYNEEETDVETLLTTARVAESLWTKVATKLEAKKDALSDALTAVCPATTIYVDKFETLDTLYKGMTKAELDAMEILYSTEHEALTDAQVYLNKITTAMVEAAKDVEDEYAAWDALEQDLKDLPASKTALTAALKAFDAATKNVVVDGYVITCTSYADARVVVPAE